MIVGYNLYMAKVLTRDITSAVHVLDFVCNLDGSEVVVKMIKNIVKELVTQSKIKPIPIKTLKAYNHGRVPTKSQFKNPIIVAQFKRKKIILDGNHRVLLARSKKLDQLKGVVINLNPYPTLFDELQDYGKD